MDAWNFSRGRSSSPYTRPGRFSGIHLDAVVPKVPFDYTCFFGLDCNSFILLVLRVLRFVLTIIIFTIISVQENVTPDRFSLLCSICQKPEGACLTVCSDIYDDFVQFCHCCNYKTVIRIFLLRLFLIIIRRWPAVLGL